MSRSNLTTFHSPTEYRDGLRIAIDAICELGSALIELRRVRANGHGTADSAFALTGKADSAATSAPDDDAGRGVIVPDERKNGDGG